MQDKKEKHARQNEFCLATNRKASKVKYENIGIRIGLRLDWGWVAATD